MQQITPFHVAIPVHNLAECRKFYNEVLECEEGRSSDHWVDFSLFGLGLLLTNSDGVTGLHAMANFIDGSPVPLEWSSSVIPQILLSGALPSGCGCGAGRGQRPPMR